MTKKSKFYDIIPKEKRSIRNISISEKGTSDDEVEKKINHGEMLEESVVKKTVHKNATKKHDHNESSSVEIKKLERPITNVEDYDTDEYIEIIDRKISDDETTEEIHILGENKHEIENKKIPELTETEDNDFTDYTNKNTAYGNGRNGIVSCIRGFFKGSYKLPIFIFTILIVCFFALNLFASTTITIKTESLRASLGSGVSFDQGNGETLQSTTTDSVSVPATGTIKLDKRSTGTVVIFNNTTASQKLTKGTRLQSSNGLVYLLNSAVTVPAKKTVSKKVTMGSVTTTFSAEASGDKYNSGPKDFTFPGFKGTAKFTTIYGRSKGSIAGGYSGEVPNISQKDLSGQVSDAKDKMRDVLLAELKQQADARGLIINNDTLQYKIINSEARLSDDKKQAVIKIDGTLQAETLLNASITESSKGILGVEDANGLSYSINLSSSTLDVSTAPGDNQISVTGDVQINTSVNKEELAKSLENKGKNEALAILQGAKGVTYAKISVFPFWKMSLSKASRITLLVQD
ncbi:MAG: hypothetical protein WCQ00_02040 [bacterium]